MPMQPAPQASAAAAVFTTSGDPIAVILARLEVKLDQALNEQGKHATLLDRHDSRLNSAEQRLTALETRGESEQASQAQLVSTRALFWTAVGSVTAVVASH